MSDPHFQNEGTIRGLNPRVRLSRAIDHVNTHQHDADLVILSGDLVGNDIDADYGALATYLSRSTVPVYPMVGNNDDRDGFHRHLTVASKTMSGFVQYTIMTDAGLVVCLDTHQEGTHAGQFCDLRRDWLISLLDKHATIPTYIFMHHPPMSLGLPKQDELMLQDGEAFLNLVQNHGNVRHLFMGHVHRPTCGTIKGIPFATIGALSFQAPAPRPVWDWSDFTPAVEPPHYGIVLIDDGNVTLQYTQFCPYETGMEA